MNSLEDIRRKLETMEMDQAANRATLTEIHVALIGRPLDPKAPPGMVEVVEEHGMRIKAIEGKHRTVIKWAIAGIGTVLGGALAAAGALAVDLVRSGRTGGH